MVKDKKEESEQQEKEIVDVSKEVQAIIDAVSKLNVLQLSELVKALQDKFGVTAAAPVTMVAPTGTEEPEASEEKDSYNVILKSDGGNKIPVIKALREIYTDLGLKEAKELIDGVPSAIEENVEKERAEEIKKKLEDIGAEVELS